MEISHKITMECVRKAEEIDLGDGDVVRTNPVYMMRGAVSLESGLLDVYDIVETKVVFVMELRR